MLVPVRPPSAGAAAVTFWSAQVGAQSVRKNVAGDCLDGALYECTKYDDQVKFVSTRQAARRLVCDLVGAILDAPACCVHRERHVPAGHEAEAAGPG